MQIKVDREMAKCRRFLRDRIHPHVEHELEMCSVATYVNPGEPQPHYEFIKRAESGQIRFRPISQGESWGTLWGTTWFRIEGAIPEGKDREHELDLVVNLGWTLNTTGGQCEGLVFAPDGRAIKGIQPFNSWVRLRGDGAMENLIKSDGTFRLYLEAGCNPMLLNYPRRFTDMGEEASGCVYSGYAYGGISLCRFDHDLWMYERDLEIVMGLIETLDRDSVRYWQVVKALQRSLNIYDDDKCSITLSQARDALTDVLSRPANSTTFHEYAVGHAHIDTAYLWPKRETRRKIGRTVSNVLALMDQEPNFLFAMSSAQHYAWLEEDYPDLFKRVKDYIDNDRFIPVGGMWVEADSMVPSGESLVRQISFGRQYFKNHLGVQPKGIWLPDSFGYSGAFPQIARRAGYSWFLSQKLSWNDTNQFPHHSFIWEGIDGTCILTHFPPTDTYAAEITPNELRYSEVNARDKESIDRGLLLYGYGDGGGGPTREMLGRLSLLGSLEGLPTCTSASPNAFFSGLSSQLRTCEPGNRPYWHGELYLELHRATLTSQQEMKANCRKEESLLRVMEYVACLAELSNIAYQYPDETMKNIWQRLLVNQFHDILPGSSIAWVHRQAEEDYCNDMNMLKTMIRQGIEAIRTGISDCPMIENSRISQADWHPHTCPSDDFEVLQKTYRNDQYAPTIHKTDQGYVLRNRFIQATVNAIGLVDSCIDLVTGRDVVAKGQGLGTYRLLVDKPCERDAWELDRDAFQGPVELGRTQKIVPIASSSSSGVEVTTRIGSATTIRTQIILDCKGRGLRFQVFIDWKERDRFLKVSFPLSIQAASATYECQYGTVDRPIYRDTEETEPIFESCTHRFIHIHEGGYGLGLVNSSTYGSSTFPLQQTDYTNGCPGTLLELSLLSSPTFPDPNTDVGRVHEFSWELLPGADLNETVREAGEINAPVISQFPDVESLIDLQLLKGTILLDWVKPADDGSRDIVMRLYEPVGEQARARIHASKFLTKARVCETDLLEEEGQTYGLPTALKSISKSSNDMDGSPTAWTALEGAQLSLGPYQLVTLRVHP